MAFIFNKASFNNRIKRIELDPEITDSVKKPIMTIWFCELSQRT